MATFVEELIARLELDTDERSFKDGEKGVQRINEQLGKMVKIAATAAAAIGAAAVKMVFDFANASVEVDRFARLSNSTTDEFQRFAAGSDTVGISLEKSADILKDVNDRVGDFMTTGAGPMADFFEKVAPKVGVTADMFAKLSGPQALQLYVDSLQKANLSQQEMTFFMEAMASDSSLLIPLLRDGGKAMRELGDAAAGTGQIIDQETIEQGKKFNRELALMQGALTGVRNTVATELLPTLTELLTQVRDFVVQNREIIKSSIVLTIRAAAVAMKALAVATGLFVAYKIGFYVIAATRALNAMTVATLASRAAVLGLWAGMAIGPIIIGTLIAAIALLSQDLYTFLNGGDSLIGRFIDKFPTLGAAIKAVITQAKDMMDILMGILHLDFDYAGDAFGKMIDRWMGYVKSFVGWLGGFLPQGLKDFFGMAGGAISGFATAPTGGSGNIPMAPLIPAAVQSSVTNSNSRSMVQNDNRTITINGTDIAEIKRYIGQQNAYTAKTLVSGDR